MSRRVYMLALTAATVIIGSVGGVCYLPRPRNPPVVASRTIEASMPVPGEVEIILARSCKDCHSFETRWPWYSRMPFVSGMLLDDVERARAHVNLSDWTAEADQGKDEERGTLNGICEELRSANMPLHTYLLMHPASKPSEAETELVCSWTDRLVLQHSHP